MMRKLLQVYRETDAAIQKDLAVNGRDVPCGKGCSHCCHNADIPVSKPEIFGIMNFVKQNADPETLGKIEERLENPDENDKSCPFLVDTNCGIYAVRPLACRSFYIHGKACEPDEDISRERADDIHVFPAEDFFQATRPLLELYGFETEAEQQAAWDDGFLLDQTFPMHHFDWSGALLPVIKAKKESDEK